MYVSLLAFPIHCPRFCPVACHKKRVSQQTTTIGISARATRTRKRYVQEEEEEEEEEEGKSEKRHACVYALFYPTTHGLLSLSLSLSLRAAQIHHAYIHSINQSINQSIPPNAHN